MDGIDLDVLKRCAQWIKDGRKVLLVTVVRTWGSSPRPIGSMLAIRESGVVVGSVSGGCIEDDLIMRVHQSGIVQGRPVRLTYGIDADQAHRFGLPCGGTLELVTEPLSNRSRIGDVLEAISHGRSVRRILCMETGEVVLEPALAGDVLEFDSNKLVSIYGPRFRLLVIGGGHSSRYLCQIAQGLDFQITVCDPREEYVCEWDLPGVNLVKTMPDDTIIDMRLDMHCAVLALTHDPKLDDLALMEALKTQAFYVGAIGSRKNNHARRKRLKEFDLTEEQIKRLRGPVGVYIGSKTPAEIAVSIMAEIIAVRNGIEIPTEWDVERRKTARAISGAESITAGCVLDVNLQ